MHSCHSDRSGGIYLNSHRRRRFHILVFLCSCIPAFFIKSLRVLHVLHGKFFCAFLDSFLHKLNVTPPPLNTQNKPIFSNLRIAVSLCGKRTQASSLKPRASENKPIQTHFIKMKSALICDDLSRNIAVTIPPSKEKTQNCLPRGRRYVILYALHKGLIKDK